MVEASARSSPRAGLTKRRTEPFATRGASRTSMEWGLSVGSIALTAGETMGPFAGSLIHTVAELVMRSGTRTNATGTILSLAARSGAPCGTLGAGPPSTTSPVACARPTARRARLTSASLALRSRTVEGPGSRSSALRVLRCQDFSATLLARQATRATALSAGSNAPPARQTAEVRCASTLLISALISSTESLAALSPSRLPWLPPCSLGAPSAS